ncbi:MAG: SulP family inorganic anion transporter [Cyanobacteria bacterium CRU_2_1]|nr:SulP family inorganic anion transporter [Cyanobacteria bacterium RU_5_0]NJR57670.1 SulP family inorganic anion transporter [Cyanobacteria bacterium CRU_2_1]
MRTSQKKSNGSTSNTFFSNGINSLKLNFLTLKTESLAGITVALALIPESLAFAAIAKVSPMVALYTSFCMAVVIAIAGGRPAMISAATGSMALLMTTLVEKYGVEYLFAATILTGILQFLIGIFKLGRFFNFIPQSVISGFVNALGILILLAQLQQLSGQPWQAYGMVAVTLAIVYLLPSFTKSIPSPLVAIVVMTSIAVATKLDISRVGDIGEITRRLPAFHLPAVSFSLETLMIILPYSLALAIVGLLESLLTAALVDDLTHTHSSKNQEIRGQGIANFVTGCLGGMAGCGMVGQSIINVRCGGRGRLSTGIAGAFLLFSIFALRDVVLQIPMAALIGVMIMVAFETFDWNSLKIVRRMPLSEAIVMPITMIVALWTHDLAEGVLAGVIISTLMFSWQVAQIKAMTWINSSGAKVYTLSGQLFFGSATRFTELFNYRNDPDRIIIDFTHAHIWDHAAASAIIKAVSKYHHFNKQVMLIGLNIESYAIARKSGIPEDIVNFDNTNFDNTNFDNTNFDNTGQTA